MFRSKIVGCKHFLPKNILTNNNLSEKLETSDEWIVSRTGIKQRHIVQDETCTSMGYMASKKLLDDFNIDPLEIDLIIVATCTADQIMPSTGIQIQKLLKADNAFCFDLQAACAGFVYAISVADQFIQTGKAQKVLVVGSEVMSRTLNWEDRSTCVLFGDGAGAVLLTRSDDQSGIIDFNLFSDGNKENLVCVNDYLTMRGPELFKHAVDKLGSCIIKILIDNKMKIEDIDWFVPHQANIRIIEFLSKKFNIPIEKFIITIDKHANTSSASIPIALSCALAEGKIKKGDKIILEGIGSGLAWGSVLLVW